MFYRGLMEARPRRDGKNSIVLTPKPVTHNKRHFEPADAQIVDPLAKGAACMGHAAWIYGT